MKVIGKKLVFGNICSCIGWVEKENTREQNTAKNMKSVLCVNLDLVE